MKTLPIDNSNKFLLSFIAIASDLAPPLPILFSSKIIKIFENLYINLLEKKC